MLHLIIPRPRGASAGLFTLTRAYGGYLCGNKTCAEKTGLPVWLAGVSIGSIRASLYAIGGYEPIDGLVLASAPTNPSRGIGIDKFVSLSRLRIPFLIFGHTKDECPGTPAEGAQKIVELAVNAVDRRVMIFDGGENEGNHVCKPFTPHTFYGIEDEVGAAIANYMMANLPQ